MAGAARSVGVVQPSNLAIRQLTRDDGAAVFDGTVRDEPLPAVPLARAAVVSFDAPRCSTSTGRPLSRWWPSYAVGIARLARAGLCEAGLAVAVVDS